MSLLRTEKQKMLAGELYHADDAELAADRNAAVAWMVRYNGAPGASDAHRLALLRELLGEAGDRVVIRPPFHCDYGYNIQVGPDVFFNFNCVVLDVVAVTIGARTQIGPAVQIHVIHWFAGRASSSGVPPGSVRMCGLVAARSSCRV